jgi:hypothetical protein
VGLEGVGELGYLGHGGVVVDPPLYISFVSDAWNHFCQVLRLLAYHFENSSKGESFADTNRIILVTYREPCSGCNDTIKGYENLTSVNICVIWFKPEDKK